MKKSDDAEINVYEKFLKGKKLPVPQYYGGIEIDDKKWISLEFIESELMNTSLERDRGFEYYYGQALLLAKEITQNNVSAQLIK